jgi:DNA-binding NarL/FixJ family response regulator
VDSVTELLRQYPKLKMVVVTPGPDEELTLELFRRGIHGIVSREVEPELMVDCLRKVVADETWLGAQAIRWVLEAYRNQNSRASGSRPKVQLTPKESLIVSCVTQGMKNKEIALRVGTTEQVVKNYLRKVYDKLGVADRLELALYCLNHHVVDNAKIPALPSTPQSTTTSNGAANAAAAGASAGGGSVVSAPSIQGNSPAKSS